MKIKIDAEMYAIGTFRITKCTILRELCEEEGDVCKFYEAKTTDGRTFAASETILFNTKIEAAYFVFKSEAEKASCISPKFLHNFLNKSRTGVDNDDRFMDDNKIIPELLERLKKEKQEYFV